MNDARHMRHALTLAERGLGMVAPNPAVGCVIVRDGIVVGRGWTQRGGRPHAEVVALRQAGANARGATAYVTLEPCAHLGQTPPCANALIEAGIARVVAAVEDPDPRVSGRGFSMLREADISVETDVLRDEAAASNAGFFLRITKRRPLETLKLAVSADGKIARAPGGDQWITGEEARRFGHLLRARHDAILAGIETVLADDPELTVRIPGLEDRSPIRVVLDSALRLPGSSKLVRMARAVPLLVFTTRGGGEELRAAGVDIVRVAPDAQGRPELGAMLGELAARGVTRLLVEGGAGVEEAFLRQGFADRLEIFRAPVMVGESGRAAPVFPLENYGLTARRALGADVLESFAVRA
ncbi:MAG TPA: bifunctional diaminohydroxyphosphoribosylaminopyrimidine deaminase/5-amino-6-(5-phosphoribosylamino)uracil reductase RibD [Rhizomicrobium sp.]